VRDYRFLATDATTDALRLLRGAWAGYRVARDAVTVRLADGREVRIAVEGADVEPDLEAFRIAAAVEPFSGLPRAPAGPFRDAPDFAVSRNDVVLFTGATWIVASATGGASAPGAPPAPERVVQFSGHPGQIAASAAAVCLTTDAVVVASPVGTGILVRTGLAPHAVEVVEEAVELARFLTERDYGAAG
jgi:hypothetical protein